mgnify:CR=1 FL=1
MGIHDAFVTEYFIAPDLEYSALFQFSLGTFQFALGNGPVDQGLHELRLMEGFFLRRVDLQPEAIILYKGYGLRLLTYNPFSPVCPILSRLGQGF